MLGISVYFKDLDFDYLEFASKLGVEYVFISLHIPEEDLSQLDAVLPKFLKYCNDVDLKIVPDISPITFEKLNIEPNNFKALKELGFNTVRLDFGFDDLETVKDFLKDFTVILNASVIDDEYLQNALDNSIDLNKILLMHNFYPKTNTGLSLERFKEINKSFSIFNTRLMAFVPGDELKRFPLYEGLPTVEIHRQMNPYVAAVQMMKECGISDILIGDSKAKKETLTYINDYMKNKVMTIPVIMEKEYKDMLHVEYDVRKDIPDSIVRLVIPRDIDVEIKYNNRRNKGAITMENKLSGRYSGEVYIMRKDFDMNAGSNVIGQIHPDYIDLVDYIDNKTKIKFVEVQ